MNRAIYIRNWILFALFMAVIFATPYIFAQDVTGPTLIRLNQAQINMYNESRPTTVNTQLGGGSIIRFPNPIADNLVFNGDGEINMYETLRVWNSLATELHRERGIDMRPRRSNGQVLYPVQVLQAPGSSYNLNNGNLGWVPLGQLLRPLAFNTVRATPEAIEEAEEVIEGAPNPILDPVDPPAQTAAEPAQFPFFMESDEFSEVTSPDGGGNTLAPSASLRPSLRPDNLVTNPAPPAPVPVATGTVTDPHSNGRCERIRGDVASALGLGLNSGELNCYLDLFHTETSCRHDLPQAQGNAGNPHAAYGLCSIEASPAVRARNRRGPHCEQIDTVAQQARCCAAMMEDTNGRYFGPVIRGEVDRCDLL